MKVLHKFGFFVAAMTAVAFGRVRVTKVVAFCSSCSLRSSLEQRQLLPLAEVETAVASIAEVESTTA
jgi:hypothetical protein